MKAIVDFDKSGPSASRCSAVAMLRSSLFARLLITFASGCRHYFAALVQQVVMAEGWEQRRQADFWFLFFNRNQKARLPYCGQPDLFFSISFEIEK